MLKASDLAVLEGRKSFRIDGSLEECAEYQCKHADLDPCFAEFFKWAKASGVRVILLSAGLEPLIRALVGHLLGTEAAAELQIISNEAVSWQDPCGNTRRNWQVKLHDSTEFGMDKSIHIQAYAKRLGHIPKNKRPTLLFAGDGVSDLSAARSADILFAKAGKDLITYCEREKLPFIPFNNWEDILRATKDML
ncbi:hypothetical protein P3342_012879 [Pyrenophora teres f. teres]|nr:hypothetical protein P3342_012879 [Pyrenophora teres f. teres]